MNIHEPTVEEMLLIMQLAGWEYVPATPFRCAAVRCLSRNFEITIPSMSASCEAQEREQNVRCGFKLCMSAQENSK